MSNALAIGATTETLRSLLQRGLSGESGVAVTTLPLDLAKTFSDGDTGRLNLFLYHTQANAAWRNQDPPRQLKPGETGQPALALDLFYLVTPYESNPAPASIVPHRLLGRAMSTLHDHTLLGAKEIRDAFAGSELEDQVERVRITPHPLSVEDLSKLWVIFQTEYRISAAYQVSVVLIESTRGVKAPLPVLTRGKDDRGVAAQGDLIPPFPSLDSIGLPEMQRTANLGTLLTVKGHHLAGSGLVVEAAHPRLAAPVLLALEPGNTDTEFAVKLPTTLPSALAAGVCMLTMRLTKPGETFERTTNGLPFALAPEITNSAANPIGVTRTDTSTVKNVTITLECQPAVLPGQRVALLLGDRDVPAPPRTASETQLKFVADTSTRPITGGKYFVRLRVDGVDSELVKYTGQPPKPSFNSDLQITVL
ncbi:MAG: DUF4255 domain-containing protein [Chthoniobacteraceae bacterium]